MSVWRVCTLIILTALLAACGNTGALYLPKNANQSGLTQHALQSSQSSNKTH